MVECDRWCGPLVLLLAAAVVEALAPRVAVAQQDDEAVMAPIKALFDAMRARDSAAARAVFHPEARLVGTAVRDGRPVVTVSTIDGFVGAIGRDREVWNERIWDWEVRVDGGLAVVWTKYDFLRGEQFSHCGVDGFQLVRTAEGWRIIQVADTRRTEGCEAPSAGAYPPPPVEPGARRH